MKTNCLGVEKRENGNEPVSGFKSESQDYMMSRLSLDRFFQTLP